MLPVNFLIKPASSACNMACRYCFYRDVSEHRAEAFQGMLSMERMEALMREGIAYAEGVCSFAFQGGEPTLAGLDFFREVVALGKKYARPGVQVHYALQTNGLLLDEEWAEFLAKEHFLVGLSLDGPAGLHDSNRVDRADGGTYSRVMHAAGLLRRHGVDFNILTVLTGANARSIEKIYRFFRRNQFDYLQFIPCLEALEGERGQAVYHLSPERYGDFLIRIFDLWHQDLKRGEYVSIRHLDNWMSILLGRPPESCDMNGRCSVQFVVEGDGGVYPCDFYVLDEWRLGTLGQDSLADMAEGETARRFVETSLEVPARCRACRYYGLCRNGCRRNRLPDSLLNYYCPAYERFFTEREQALLEAAARIRSMQFR